ncbi:exo-alpha-sialidase [Candidatus Sumerlaeota bacterium]|nr:exo-alpha-sialidase [Candidatus Sumerlaeota bacterium]
MKKIWDQAPYNSFTDLAFFNGKWFCAFREGNTHWGKGDCGKVRIIYSTDGETWESAALLSEEGADLRDAKLSITPDNRLMLLYFRRFNPTAYPEKHEQSFTRFSKDGFTWDEPNLAGTTERWLWRVAWHKGVAYGFDYGGPDGAPPFQAPRTGRFYSSDDGIHFKTIFECEHAGESAIFFLEDDTALLLIRSEGDNAVLGTARPPYANWEWKDLKRRLGGPQMIRLPDGRFVVGGRLYEERARTSLLWLDPDKGTLEEFLTLPSGGDTSYPGMVYKDGMLWVSYYSSHEGKTSIYLAKVKFP